MSNHNIHQILKTVEQYYLEGKYQSALDLLLEQKNSFDEGTFHYNLGTVYAKQKLFPIARFHFEKAIKKGFYNPEVLNNLDYVVEKLGLQHEVQDDAYFEQIILKAKQIPDGIYISMSLFIILAILLLAKFKYLKNIKIIGSALFLSLIPTLLFFFYLNKIQLAIAIKEVELREGPSRVYEVNSSIGPGSRLIIGNHHDEWFFIKYPKNKTGWVTKDDIAVY